MEAEAFFTLTSVRTCAVDIEWELDDEMLTVGALRGVVPGDDAGDQLVSLVRNGESAFHSTCESSK